MQKKLPAFSGYVLAFFYLAGGTFAYMAHLLITLLLENSELLGPFFYGSTGSVSVYLFMHVATYGKR